LQYTPGPFDRSSAGSTTSTKPDRRRPIPALRHQHDGDRS